MSRSALRVILGILAVVILTVIAIGAVAWWKMAKLKEELVQGLGNAIGAQVQVASLDLDLWRGELHAAGISLTNDRPSAPWEKGAISQATVRFNLVDIFSRTLPLSVDVSAWNIVLTPNASSTAMATTPTLTPSGTITSVETPTPTKARIQVTQLSAHDGSVEIDLADNHQIILSGVGFVANDNSAGTWTTELQASSVKAGSLEAGASSVQVRTEYDKAVFSNLRLTCGPGVITGEGEVSLDGTHEMKATLQAAEVPIIMLVGVEWQMKLSGQVAGDLTYDGDDQGGSAKGQITLNHAKFNILPWLGKVTALVSLPDITDVEVDKATSDFTWNAGKLELTHIDIRKNDVTRISGTADIDPTGMVDARLKLGLPSAVIAKWPQLQEKIFSVQLEDYNWADVHLTGPPDHLQEDLSPRLLATSMQQGGTLMDEATQKATDLWKSFMGK
jgi:hypothetical protein